MKVLLMHRHDGLAAGAQVQMNRLLHGLRDAGVDARILCREGDPDEAVLMPYQPRLERWIGKFTRRMGLNDLNLVSSFRVPELEGFKEADIIDLHCLHSGAFSYAAIPALAKDKPVVFTFHDMWPITGHCHASLECERWKTGCGQCPHLDIYPPVRRDATALEWKLKRRAYERSEFTIVAPSKWLCDRIGESMLGDFPVHHIPHGVDLEVFSPLDKDHCRRMLGIPEGKTVLLSVIDMGRPLKGPDLLAEAIRMLPESQRRDCLLLVVGSSNHEILKSIPVPVMDLGYVGHDPLKALIYSAADLLINPTRAESFGLVSLESMACGTPTVAFDVGGVPDVVRPGVTGALAEPESAESLAAQISGLLGDPGLLESMRGNCRALAIEEFSLDLQVKRYAELYEKVIDARLAGN